MSQQMLTGLAVLAFVSGIAALVLEIFIIPGFGVAGLAGIMALAWGVLLLTVDFTQATAALVLALVASLVIFAAGVVVLRRTNLWSRLFLHTRQYKEAGYVSSSTSPLLTVGCTGRAVTPLRPAGIMELGGQRFDVVTGGEYIPVGSQVQVVSLTGGKIVVRRAE
ncbi:NfeD family protein [Desulfurispora thermophila]|uniref:NfeD family protein n=1 Tax=Desulfurispora thermophila TaxID=265470 RepID=UPI00037D0ABE|nr:NfeD family protein [Desulfurispora thermophila]